MFLKLTVLLLALSAIQAKNLFGKGVVSTSDCGSASGKLEELFVEGCDSTPCNLIKGKSSTWRVKFSSSVKSTKLTSKVFGVIFGVPIPFGLPEPDTCKLGAHCPVNAGDVNQIVISLPILSVYPSLSLNVRWQLLDENNKNVFCLQVPVKITN